MSHENMKYWSIFIEGYNEHGKSTQFVLPYSGVKILFEYLIESIEEDYNLRHVKINGYDEIDEYQYKRMLLNDRL